MRPQLPGFELIVYQLQSDVQAAALQSMLSMQLVRCSQEYRLCRMWQGANYQRR
jgi:hypothetical protein